MSFNDKYEMVCGVETHVEMATKTKIFCGCTTEFGGEQNTHVCPVCLGLPGVLPVLNKEVVNLAIKAGLALNCEIAQFSKFDRKNYFYPDLTKNYQTSQYDLPICKNGWLDVTVNGTNKRIGITRAHMEEDAGKLVHSGETIMTSSSSGVDYNRTGVPLLEIVSEPDMRSIDEVLAYLEQLVQIMDYAGISDCKLEQGSVRFDINVSLRLKGTEQFGTRTETKNLNSFSSVRRCLEYETERQAEALDDGQEIIQETRTWDEGRGMTLSLRSKEEAHDYRYFPEPDLMPLVIDRDWVERIRASLPELPAAKKARLQSHGLSEYDAGVITASRAMAAFFDQALARINDAKLLANWVMGDLSGLLKTNGRSFEDSPVSPEQLAGMLTLIKKGDISGKIGKNVLEEIYNTGKDPETIIKEKGLVQISDESELGIIVDGILAANEKSVTDYQAGKESALGFLVGQVMKATRGQANPGLVNKLLKEKLAQ
ncbi:MULTISPECIES: Asp-tRNA(Asn)/Glu-tRNA(Gln) amidotransferase subunit GatB [Dehalobacter]|jgi:aspartyl-tRNA(Asn)/glutamyl-tRNA(Gln) amidotransferase subunit B|uniref:Aspartyl/glutamyl-tRNA(Asn/Gln) amidotransferase subunit B n=2 Tax=Dehalobacter restrictus TaxID=55583 RepID=A0A857DJY0_9FIRM|nr:MULTISPECIES: Asp-tRNA(Asn)/Glu-tRNA(Gln) amidotransferase subunit GatB [Dehalobacter]AHF10497.1 aspartyl/glutamyl-tRNA amidotransferase subunit B [Dehalobacter restrictus DSM 9455]MCG1025420.1 Asp-tRNA(Asn)/Glu-tRNA(Gln) amidotransferase subunit GatB [Dehalobacter sp.]MDJ0305664.1 Asp-tRNA(Asn)/Glu-tRNA(Gln) amidotransferase subunit GatB [Dehalobacter sp.]OCZ51094.1 aspartyl/glutamyl-tRNA amidotransferase subunit B [Dehalobacter sp. TeCB1]QHA01123.1 Asp-tRNA(Asn)/Glu-tRNA(Gln) amidotransfe